MAQIIGEKISKSFGEKTLLNEVSFSLADNDKVGIIGVNGTGKTTFLNMIGGKIEPDVGKIVASNNLKISYLQQEPTIDENLSLLDIVFKNADSETKSSKEYEAKSILTKLGFQDLSMDTKNMSGGEIKRVAIARALANPCDVLILDEPTNHLDSEMIFWLENYLQKFKGIIVMVTHDRYFLDRVTNRIIEIDSGNLYSYKANYSTFLQLKMEREEMELATARKNKILFKKELEWIRRGPQGRGTKSKERINRFNELSDGTVESKEKLAMTSVSSRLGKKTIEIKNVSKSFGQRVIIKDFTYNVMRDGRIGIVGENGKGKSTLVKIITKNLEPDTGEVVHGETVKVGYVTQQWEEPDGNKKVIDYIKDVAELVVTKDGIISASKMLEKFLFPPEVQWNLISNLSGGEKRRLYLLKVLMEAPNILFLDEPTNDLDIETLTILEDYLDGFNGAVITISHDRYFLDKVVDVIFAFEKDGVIKQYNGGYSDYLEKREFDTNEKEKKEKVVVREKTKKLKFSYNEQKEFESIDEDMENLENDIAELTLKANEFANDFEKLMEITTKKDELEKRLSMMMDRWVYLNDLADRIERGETV